MITGRYGSGRSALRVFGCGRVADGCLRRVVQLVYCLSICPRHQVSVGIDGELDGSVSNLVPHVGKRFPILNEQAREGVSNGVGTVRSSSPVPAEGEWVRMVAVISTAK